MELEPRAAMEAEQRDRLDRRNHLTGRIAILAAASVAAWAAWNAGSCELTENRFLLKQVRELREDLKECRSWRADAGQ